MNHSRAYRDVMTSRYARIDPNGWECPKCYERDDEFVNLRLHSREHIASGVEYWMCSECETEYQVDIEIERDFIGMVEVLCKVCDGNGWINTFNTQTNQEEVQRCDHCKAIETDSEAQQVAADAHNEFQYPTKKELAS